MQVYGFSPEHLLSIRTLTTHTAEDQTRTWQGFNADRNTDMRSARLQFVERQLFSGQVAGTHGFNFGEPELLNGTAAENPETAEEVAAPPDLSLEWRATYSRASQDEPDTRETIYEDRGDGTYTFRDSTKSGSRFFFDLEDDEYNARVDLKVPVPPGGFFQIRWASAR